MTDDPTIQEPTDEDVFLNLKKEHQDFVIKLRTDGLNQVKAYMAVYQDSSYEAACSSASDLLRNPKIQSSLRFFDEQSSKALGLNESWIKKRLMNLGNGTIESHLHKDGSRKELNELTSDELFSIGEMKEEIRYDKNGDKIVTRTLKLSDRKGALSDLAKITGMVVDKKEVTGKDGGPIENRNTVVIDKDSFEEIVDLL